MQSSGKHSRRAGRKNFFFSVRPECFCLQKCIEESLVILGIGVDTIDIKRFSLWHTYTLKKLRRIFSAEEIEYCLENTQKSAERFSVRFAAREALYKALCNAYPEITLPFLTLCAHTTIKKIGSRPVLELRSVSGIDVNTFVIHLSLSHSREQATAFVVLESA